MPQEPEQQLQLPRGEIHLWMTRPGAITEPALLERYFRLMSTEEALRQQRYRSPEHRHNALVTRAFVRDLLSAYAAVAPADWRFIVGDKGKPEIVDPPLPLRFNLSHTRDLIICAVTASGEIGSDVEDIQRQNNLAAIAEQHFAAEELAELFTLPEEQQRSRFFDYWTLKESYIKACGGGIFATPLKNFSFSIGERPGSAINDKITLRFAAGIEDSPARWRSWLLSPDSRYRVAISVRQEQRISAQAESVTRFRLFRSTPLLSRRELAADQATLAGMG